MADQFRIERSQLGHQLGQELDEFHVDHAFTIPLGMRFIKIIVEETEEPAGVMLGPVEDKEIQDYLSVVIATKMEVATKPEYDIDHQSL